MHLKVTLIHEFTQIRLSLYQETVQVFKFDFLIKLSFLQLNFELILYFKNTHSNFKLIPFLFIILKRLFLLFTIIVNIIRFIVIQCIVHTVIDLSTFK